MSTLKESIKSHVKEAMKAKNMPRLGVLRQITAAIKQVEVDTRTELGEQEVLALLEKLKKQRIDARDQFIEAQRADLAEKEEFELGVLADFFPEQLTDKEIDVIVKEAIVKTNAEKVTDMAKVMALIKPQVLGKASMKDIGEKIKALLS